jgi:hypothetical protein
MIWLKKEKKHLIFKNKFKSVWLLIFIGVLLLALSGGCANKKLYQGSAQDKADTTGKFKKTIELKPTNEKKIQPVISSNDKLRFVFEDNAREAVQSIIPEIETFAQSSRNATSITTIMLEEESWKENGKWNRFSEGYYLSFKKALKDKYGKRFIEPYSSFDDQSAAGQMGRMNKIDPDEFMPGDILIRISSMVDSTGFNFFVKVKKFNSALEIASFHRGVDYDDAIRYTAKQWKNMAPLFDKPAYPGSLEMPFSNLDKTATFLSKVICSALPEIKEKYGNISDKRLMVALSNESSAPLELGNEFTNLISGKLKGYCSEINQILMSDGQIQSIQQAVARFQSGLFHQSESGNEKYSSLGLKIPNMLLWVNMNKTMNPSIYHISLNAVWMDAGKRGDMLNELYAEAYLENKDYYAKINLHENNQGLEGIWVEPATNGQTTKNIVITGVEIRKIHPSSGTVVWLPDTNGPFSKNSFEVNNRTDLMQILMKKPIEGQGIVQIRYHIKGSPEQNHTTNLVYSR